MHTAPAITQHPPRFNEDEGNPPFHSNSKTQALEGDKIAIAEILSRIVPRHHGTVARQPLHMGQGPPYGGTARPVQSVTHATSAKQPLPDAMQPQYRQASYPQPSPMQMPPAHSVPKSAQPVPMASSSPVHVAVSGDVPKKKKKKGKKGPQETPRVGSGRFSPLGHIRA